jgi:sn-glycerol 3-phosphate transport system substrate-binding protein
VRNVTWHRSARPWRRDLLRACAALGFAPLGCEPRGRAVREGGRIVVPLWYGLGDLVRKVLLDLVQQFNASQSRIVIKPVHQGDYFETLAKLRTAVAAGVAPALSHVVLEVLPYLARAGVLEPLDGYDGAAELPFVRSLAQQGAFTGEAGRPLFAVPFNRHRCSRCRSSGRRRSPWRTAGCSTRHASQCRRRGTSSRAPLAA